MADINDLKSKVLETLGTVADKTKDVAGKAAGKAKAYAKITKLSVEISGEKETIKKAYIEIGKIYYDMHKDDPEGIFSQLCEEITLAICSINDKENEISSLKNSDDDGCDCGCCDECVDDDEVCSEPESECCCENSSEDNCCQNNQENCE